MVTVARSRAVRKGLERMSEIHLFIIWAKAEKHREIILGDIRSRFEVLGVHRVAWRKDHFSENLTRFYGENLPKNSGKIRICGDDPFTLVVIRDKSPLYRKRKTSKGIKEVNINIFDAKEMYRYWTGGNLVHGTNNIKEVRHDLVLLTGLSVEDYLVRYGAEGELNEEFDCLVGEDSWMNADQLLYVLNECIDYIILRNFDGIFSEDNRTVHGDVDLLVDNYYNAQKTLNAIPTHFTKKRVQNKVRIGEGYLNFDIRFVGDNYYCAKWEQAMLAGRFLTEAGYYRSDETNYKYGLLYHALVQKKSISPDYLSQFKTLFPDMLSDEDNEKWLEAELLRFMENNKYSMHEPKDYTVYFNPIITKRKMSFGKVISKSIHKFVDR